jgi:hypothetical protein
MNVLLQSKLPALAPFPALTTVDGVSAPDAPRDLRASGLDPDVLSDLTIKAAHTAPRFTTKWMSDELRLPVPLTESILEQLARDHILDMLGQEGPFNHRYAISGRGRDRAVRLLETTAYVGPAPVSLEAYSAMTHWQHSQLPEVGQDTIRAALAELVLPEETVVTASLAYLSQRSLFLFGPSGNGKTSLARLLHDVVDHDLWIPYAIAVGADVIQIYDSQTHQRSDYVPSTPWKIDRRWVRVRRPFIVAGGEMNIESLEMAYSPARGLYEAPLHIKSNGGTFVIDDLGRQRIAPETLLNRWIIPLEHNFDFFTLRTGTKVKVPFQQMLIVATNLDPEKVMDQAFLRRMGYRAHLARPCPLRYREIFKKCAARWNVDIPPGLVERLLQRYRDEGRELRGCEPRDLIGRVQDICQLRRQPMELNDQLIDLAWVSYFGNSQPNQ